MVIELNNSSSFYSNMFEIVHFSIKVISNTCTLVFNVQEVHEIRCLTLFWRLNNISTIVV